ncbi:DUF2235 domain-containing protein [Chromobacterium sp. Beijing]|uniref:T6SS phospholipase effector Tle1-like catalytic domain-containing protein n=1 Tax=Chromobacterium sp. Beijing TaxID=2735795 RepID=UPI001F1F11E9|nr:DUF2235 domain-containing protein [Chromobacterium sp. Beijing]UJB30484.1 DUF2235 domain-containing protein [Chromobacterium sp. Beijing]
MNVLSWLALRLLGFAILFPFLQGCSNIYYEQQLAVVKEHSAEPQKFAIFFDGTANDVQSNTNVKRLHSMISMQNQPNISTLYIEGVGVNGNALGAATGLGFKNRVALAYDFLLTHYQAGDEIYLFGFSRGAYAARVLASMLQYIGLPDQPPDMTEEVRSQKAKALFQEMKDGFHERRFPCEIAVARGGPEKQSYRSRMVKVLGLWDTVGALGGGVGGWDDRLLHKAHVAPLYVDIDEPNGRYGDQILNVEQVFHAVSLDDDREWIFTPLLMTRQHLLTRKFLPDLAEAQGNGRYSCPNDGKQRAALGKRGLLPAGEPDARKEAGKVREVWFAGAHSDVGGGASDSKLSGLSLNWMISRLMQANTGLLPGKMQAPEDIYGSSHDPEDGVWSALYHKMNRNLAAYALGDRRLCGVWACAGATGMAHEPMAEFQNRLCMHGSVFQRRQAMPPQEHENQYLDLRQVGRVCLEPLAKMASPPIIVEQAAGSSCPSDALAVDVVTWSEQDGDCIPAQEGR